jgi:hypothetical protein
MKPTVKIIIGFLAITSFAMILSLSGHLAKLESTTKDSHVTLTESVLVQLNFKVRLLAIDSNEACEIADYNNDGILDISAGRNWYAGPDYVPRPLRDIAEFGKDYLENNGEHAIDMDGDGWIDIVSGSFMSTEVSWYKNPGKEGLAIGKLWIQHKLQETVSQNEVTYLHDFDGDNIPEYIANSWIKENEPFFYSIGNKTG